MGYRINTLYIGPVVKLNTLAYVEEDDETICNHVECPVYMRPISTPFCSSCGSPATVVVHEEERDATFNDFLYDEPGNARFVDRLCESEYERGTLLPNHTNDGMYLHWEQIEEETVPLNIDTIGVDAAKHIETFKDFYREILDALSAFGFDYTIEYGVKAY